MSFSDAASSSDSATRLRSLVNLATGFAVGVAATVAVADQAASGVHDADAAAAVAGAGPDGLAWLLRCLTHTDAFSGERTGQVLLEHACASC